MCKVLFQHSSTYSSPPLAILSVFSLMVKMNNKTLRGTLPKPLICRRFLFISGGEVASIAGEIDNLLLYTKNELKFQLQTVVLRLLQDLLAAEFTSHKRVNL